MNKQVKTFLIVAVLLLVAWIGYKFYKIITAAGKTVSDILNAPGEAVKWLKKAATAAWNDVAGVFGSSPPPYVNDPSLTPAQNAAVAAAIAGQQAAGNDTGQFIPPAGTVTPTVGNNFGLGTDVTGTPDGTASAGLGY